MKTDDSDGNHPMGAKTRPCLIIVSGGHGTSGEHLARTALAQFAEADVEVRVVPHVATREQIDAAVDEARRRNATVLHTLVDPDLRSYMTERARSAGVAAIDLIGRLLAHLSSVLGRRPLGKPGLYRQMREEYFRRVEAIDFALAHDDGKNPSELPSADIVLVGPSRVGKTPLSIYLSTLGWKVANVPLVPGLEPPVQLQEVDNRRIIGLTVDPSQLISHRLRRQSKLGAGTGGDYSDPEQVAEEVRESCRWCRRRGIRVVDMTNRQIEEVADEIINLVRSP
ncbi:MAG TPA: pyruvate, water dikinase regulatory protein [Acidobacteriota bacterium]|nr:pyruvate, water dikinase regulatory protein [Acidobacteriota bacterium]